MQSIFIDTEAGPVRELFVDCIQRHMLSKQSKFSTVTTASVCIKRTVCHCDYVVVHRRRRRRRLCSFHLPLALTALLV